MVKHPNIKLIADLLGLSPMTVSRALRDGMSVAQEVREKVRETARSLGYHIDTRVSDVMSALRKSQSPQYRETLAFVWTPSSPGEAIENSFFQEEFEGARRRAFQLGYQVEEFHSTDSMLTGREFSRMLLSRGIRGVLIAPDLGQGRFRIGLDWQHHCCVLVGSTHWNKGLVCIEHDQYFGCVLAVRQLRRMRYQRVGLILSAATDKRSARLIQSAFISFHPLGPQEAKKLIFISDQYQPIPLKKWFKQARPEALLAHFETTFPRKEHLLAHAAKGMGLAALNWSAGEPELAGVNQHRVNIGEQAASILLERLQANRLGLDQIAPSIKIPGSWVDGESLQPNKTSAAPRRKRK
jgi:DNA-binding LacI/PurR family transcriptional regulator